MILKLLRPNSRYIPLEDGEEIHGELITNGVAVHVKNSYGRVYVAIGEVPEYGSPEVSLAEALAIIKRAAR